MISCVLAKKSRQNLEGLESRPILFSIKIALESSQQKKDDYL